jgi:hypothetical protein
VQLLKNTFLAASHRAMSTISCAVVPPAMESSITRHSPREFALDGVELEADALDASLSRHDGSGNVPILDESLPEGSVEIVRRLQG